MRPARGLVVMEVLVACVVLGMVFGVFMKVFDNSYRHSAQTRNRMVAAILAQSMLEEIEAHPYGAAAPQSWNPASADRVTETVIEGRPITMTFYKKFSYHNNSFIDSSRSDNSDIVTVTVYWREAAGNKAAATAQGVYQEDATGAKSVFAAASEVNKSLTVSVPVWR